MKNSLLLLVSIIFWSSSAFSQNPCPSVVAYATPLEVCDSGTVQLSSFVGTNFTDSFDPIVSSNWASITGTPSTLCGAVSGDALYFNASSNREAVTTSLNVLNGGTINFSLKISAGTSPCEAADFGEDVQLSYSTDGGTTWTLINTYTSGSYNNFTPITVNIPAGAKTTATRFRWKQVSFTGMDYDNWAMDDVSITTGTTGSFTYTWSPAAGISDPAIANPTATVYDTTNYVVTIFDAANNCSSSDTITVNTIPNEPASIVFLGSSTTVCNGDSVGLYANYAQSYLWSNGDTTGFIYAKETGNYSVTVTYPGGCTRVSNGIQVDVITPSTPTITIGGNTTLCGDSVVFTSSSAPSYEWSNGETTKSITVYESGDYTVTIYDVNGCPAKADTVITVVNNGPVVYASAKPAVICEGGTTQLFASSGSSFSESFDPINTSLWSSITGYASNQCGSISGDALYFDDEFTREAITTDMNVSAGGTIEFALQIAASSAPCENADGGEDVQLSYSTDGGITWTVIDTYLAGTIYSSFTPVSVNIPAGAQTTATRFKWEQISFTGSGFDNWGLDDVVITSGSTGNFSYSWSPAAGLSDPAIANPTATVTSTTTFTVTVTDINGGCSASNTVTVNTTPITPATITVTGNNQICNGDSIILTANQGIGYLWSTGDTTQSIVVTEGGDYDVTVTYSGGCTSTSSKQTIVVNTPATPVISASGPTTFCGGSVILTSSIADSYNWSNGATTQSITVSISGDYSVIITDSLGCKATSAITTVVNNGPTVIASATPDTVCVSGTTTLEAFSGSTFTDSFDPINTALWSSITGTASNACGSISGNALHFDNGTTREAVTNDLNVTAGGTLSFGLMIASGTSPCEYADSGEDVQLSYSTNGGTTWTVIATYAADLATYQTLSTITENIPQSAKTAATRFKWHQVSFSGSGFDNWIMDNVSIVSGSTGNYSYSWSPSAGISDPNISNPTAVVSGNTVYTVTITDLNTNCSSSATVAVATEVPPTATITTTGSTTICLGDSVTLTSNLGISYLWSTGDTTQSIKVGAPGNYTVTVTYAGGCTSTSAATTINTGGPAQPVITASGPTSFCGNGSVTLTSSVAPNYLWSTGETTQSITVTETGDYYVSTSDNNGCATASASIKVVNNGPDFTLTATPTSMCGSGTVQLSANTGGSFTDAFETVNAANWSSITGVSSTACGTSSGNALYFDDDFTREAITKDLNVTGGGTVKFSLIIGTGSTAFCETADSGEDVYLSYSIDGGVTWTVIQTYFTGTTYSNFTPITVAIPAAAQTSATRFKWDQTSFSGSGFDNWAIDDVAITSSNTATYTYSWTPSTGLSDPTKPNPTANISQTTTFSVTVTDINTNCSKTESVTVSTTGPNAVISPSTAEFCQGTSVTLTAPSGTNYTYQWFKNGVSIAGATSVTYNASSAGNYSVMVSQNGCTSISPAVPVTLSTGAAKITLSGSSTICQGSSVTLTASAGTSYLWSSGQTTQSIDVTQAGNYSVTVQNVAGCNGSSTSSPVTITVNPAPATPTVTYSSWTLTSSSNTGNQWFLNGDSIVGATGSTFTPAINGNYTVSVTDANGCSSTSTTINVNDLPNGVEAYTANGFNFMVYPNPANSKTTVEFVLNKQEKIEVLLYNAIGQLVSTIAESAEQNPGRYKFEVQFENAGAYYIKVVKGENSFVKKVISVK